MLFDATIGQFEDVRNGDWPWVAGDVVIPRMDLSQSIAVALMQDRHHDREVAKDWCQILHRAANAERGLLCIVLDIVVHDIESETSRDGFYDVELLDESDEDRALPFERHGMRDAGYRRCRVILC